MHGEYKPPGGKLVVADVEAALGSDAMLAEFTVGTVATAGRHALTQVSCWRDHDWRFIREEPQDPALHIGKIGGAAQKRMAGGAVLHYVTMAYDINAGMMTRVLRIGREELPGRGITRAVKRVDPLRRQTWLPRAEIIDTLAGHFRRRYGLTPDAITAGELRAARELARAKFSSSEWTARVP